MDEVRGCRYVKLEEAPTPIKTTALLRATGSDARVFGGLGGTYFYEELVRGAAGVMTGFAYGEVLVETHGLFVRGEKERARDHFYRCLPLVRFEAQLGVGGMTIR